MLIGKRGGRELNIEEHLVVLGDECGNLALKCSDVAGFVAQVNKRIEAEHVRLGTLRQSVQELATLQREASFASAEIRQAARRTTTMIGDSRSAVASSIEEIAHLIDEFVTIGSELEDFAIAIEEVGSISDKLQTIARHTGMLAINASIEAARAGEGSAGFAAVAAEVKRLSNSASEATSTVSQNINSLQSRARTVIDALRVWADRGRAARSRTREITLALESVAAVVAQFDQRSADIEYCGEQVTGHVESITEGIESITTIASQNGSELVTARDRLDDLEAVSNDMLDRIGHSGVPTRDTRYVDRALEAAADVKQVIEQAIGRGELAIEDLFDADYRPIAGTEPAQYMTRLVPFADRVVRPLLDDTAAADPAIVGCVIIDRNGYLPTHISERSHAQRPADRLWNLEFARNRQIFLDRQTQTAIDKNGEWFLFTYRQDFGDGRYRALRSVFVKLNFGGRFWGLYELGYLI